MAADFGFDAVNADRSFLKERGPDEVIELMKHYDLQPGAFAFSAAFNQCHSNTEFDRSLAVFERDLSLCRAAEFKCCVGYVQPSSDRLDYYAHFTLLCERLKRITPLLEMHDVRLGLEFIGPTTMRKKRKYDFIHTMDGIRSLIAAANAQGCVGIKLDALHWHTSGAGLLDIEKLCPQEIVYVEIMDGLGGNYDRFSMPEFHRELPGTTGVIDIIGIIQKLDALGFRGPVVVEPWNERIRAMNPPDAVRSIKSALDFVLEKAGVAA
jgi:sugar phosphate isomerase/epimerase